MHQPTGRWQLGLGLAMTTAIMWGMLPIALKGILGSLDIITITWYRFSVATLVIGGFYFVKGGFSWRKLLQGHLALLMLVACMGSLSNYWFYLVGLDYSSAEATQVMIQLAPLLFLILSVWIYKEPFDNRQLVGIAIFLFGIVLFFNLRFSQLAQELVALNGRYIQGLGFIVLASITWAIYGLAQKQLLKDFGSQEVLLVIYIAGAIVFFPGATPEDVIKLDALQWAYLIFTAFNTIIAYGAFTMALEHWEASRVGASLTIVPVLTICFVYIGSLILPGSITPEPMNQWSWLGAIFVVVGSMVTALIRPTSREYAP